VKHRFLKRQRTAAFQNLAVRAIASWSAAVLCRFGLCLVGMLLPFDSLAQTPFSISGIIDKTRYDNSITFTVVTEPGYAYGVYLNGTNFFAGGTYTIRHPDFYLVEAMRTNTTSGVVTSRLYRIIVADTSRGDTERGLPSHTPLLAIPSSSNEFAGGRLRLIVPAAFPTGYEIPVVAWAVNDQGKALRANGWLESPGHPSIFLRRGVGSGLLASSNPAGPLNYSVNLKGIHTNKTIAIQAGTVWTTASGTVSGNIVWPANSRIHVTGTLTVAPGSTLTIGAGSIVRLNAGVDIMNNGVVTINGTLDSPVVFMPNSRAQYWGGFIMTTSGAQVNATATVFSGSGAVPNWFGTGGRPGSHRSEQALFFTAVNQQINLTDCAQIYSAGQFGHSTNRCTFTLTRFLLHKATSGGEFTGATFQVNDSAFIEFPDDSSNFVNLDNDGLYLVNGTHGFTNCLFGWTKDDGIDSGGSGFGTIYYESCWFESIFHEGNSLSGFKNVFPRNSVYIDCGQGHEVGYDAPTGRVDRCLFLANKSGMRLGDNYDWDYNGRLNAMNSIVLYNHRDVFGYNWDANGWTNATGQIDVRENWLTKPDTNFPDNLIWNPATEGWRLAAFSTAAGDADVGVGMALRTPQVTLAQLTNGIPVRLSTFSTNFVSVDYAIEHAAGILAAGTLHFVPGEIVKYVRASAAQLQNQTLIRVRLHNPTRAEITANPVAYYSVGVTPPQPVLIFPANAIWRYPNVAGAQPASWTTLGFNDGAWASNSAQLGFGEGDQNLIADLSPQVTYYFRRTFTVDDPSRFATLSLELLRDDGGVVYINGTEVFRSPNLPPAPTPITFNTTTLVGQNGENDIDRATTINRLVQGQNIVAVEIHQAAPDSSDVSFHLRLDGVPPPPLAVREFRGDWLLLWPDSTFQLQQATSLDGPWTTLSTPSPAPIDPSASLRFYRLVREN
jgi:hypothetical protein